MLRLAGSRRAPSERSARDPLVVDRRRGDLRQPRAAGAVCRRDRRGRRRSAGPRAGVARSARAGSAATCFAAWRRARLLRAVVLRRALRRRRDDRGVRGEAGHRRAAGGEEGGGQDHRCARSAGDLDLHAGHGVRLAVPDRGRARLRQPVPLLLGRLQLPAGAGVSRPIGSSSWRGRRRPTRPRPAWSRSRSAITRRSNASCTACSTWATRSARPRCGSTI